MPTEEKKTANDLDNIRIKRAYEPKEEGDGYRVLVDRLWPRGISKERLGLDAWVKEIAPSDELRKWFNHDPSLFAEFQKRFRAELKRKEAREALAELVNRASAGTITLIYAAKDEGHNNAIVLRSMIANRLRRRAKARPPTARSQKASRPRATRARSKPKEAQPRP